MNTNLASATNRRSFSEQTIFASISNIAMVQPAESGQHNWKTFASKKRPLLNHCDPQWKSGHHEASLQYHLSSMTTRLLLPFYNHHNE
jgi:hypothetical protein